jgi:spore cortex biosynthesis protein YabQ
VEITLKEQLHQLFLSCGMGFILGFYYDLYRVPRLIMRSKSRAVFFQDVLFFSTSAVITFLFALAVMDGRLRFYLFLGEGIGFASYYFTIGRLVMKFSGTVTAFILKSWNLFWRLVFYPFRYIIGILRRPARKFLQIIKNLLSKIAGNFKKGLKHTGTMLYNQKKVSANEEGTEPRAVHKKGKKKK